jgi:transcriptional regulator with XRE-family HTH domain
MRMIGGELVREARKRAGLSQAELARRAGTTQSAIARLESGRYGATFETVERMLRLCGLQMIVELAPYDDSDLVLADEIRDETPDERARRLANTVNRLAKMRLDVSA